MEKSTATVANPPSASTVNKLSTACAGGSTHRAKKPRSITLDDIRVRAYLKWEAAGKPDGDGARFWLEAEEELLRTK